MLIINKYQSFLYCIIYSVYLYLSLNLLIQKLVIMKRIALLLLSSLFSITSYSTHLMGGQIVANYLSSDSTGSHYSIELTAYSDTMGIPMQLDATFDIYFQDSSGNYNFLFSSTVSYDSTSGAFLGSVQSVYGVEIYTFNDTVTLPVNGNYVIRWSECCRN